MSNLALSGGEPVRRRPFPAWPVFDACEEKLLLEVLRSGEWWRYTLGEALEPTAGESSQKSKVADFQERFAAMHGSRFGIACANGTAALEVALRALGVGAGDEVIVPPYSFIATASAPMLIGATPVFTDVEPETLNLDPARLEEAITSRTKAIVPVHFAGLAANMDAITSIASRYGIAVLEDAAHAHGGTWNGRPLGSIGSAAAFSFQASKNMTAGEGGLITTNDPGIAEMCESLVWVGRKIGRPWYEHHRLGWNYRLTEFQAALLIAQLGRLEEQTARRRRNAEYLSARLRDVPGIQPLSIPPYATGPAWHIYVLRFDAEVFGTSREMFLKALVAEGIPASAGYAHPLYRNPMFLDPALAVNYSRYVDLCPVSDKACNEVVWLEHRLLLGDEADMNDIARAVERIYTHREELE